MNQRTSQSVSSQSSRVPVNLPTPLLGCLSTKFWNIGHGHEGPHCWPWLTMMIHDYIIIVRHCHNLDESWAITNHQHPPAMMSHQPSVATMMHEPSQPSFATPGCAASWGSEKKRRQRRWELTVYHGDGRDVSGMIRRYTLRYTKGIP